MRAWIRNAVSCFVVVAIIGTGAPAWAHDGHGEGDEDSAEHAAEDMAGVSISTIKALTRGNARAQGYAGIAAAADAAGPKGAGVIGPPSVVGRWDAAQPTPVVPVFSAVLPSGKVLMWDSVGTNGVETYPDQSSTRAAVWDPATNTSKQVNLTGYNIFCAGFVQLPNGDVLVAGGNKNQLQEGIKQTHIFHWRTERWSRGPDMDSERWYPSLAALGNGDTLIVAGQDPPPDVPEPTVPKTPEVYETNTNSIRQFAQPADPAMQIGFTNREYPFLVPRTDGTVEMVGPEGEMYRYDVAGTGSITRSGQREPDYLYRSYGSFATFLPDETLVSGGGTYPVIQGKPVSVATAVVVDTTTGEPTVPTATASMAFPRRQHNLTILADGSVLATGGMNSASQQTVDLPAAVKAAERWDPDTGQWTTLSSADRIREYHSSAVLLPDGRVMTGGGGVCTLCVQNSYLEQNVEYFSPPSLFAADGSPAVRPQLTNVPGQIDNATSFSFTSSSAAAIDKLGIIRLGATTHGVDQGQRYIPLQMTASTDTTVTAMGPIDGNAAPPGYYMMFAVTEAGVPSVGAIVHVGSVCAPTTPTSSPTYTASPDSVCPMPVIPAVVSPATPTPTAAVPSPGPSTCLEIRSSKGKTSAVVRWSCTTGTDQAWKLKKKDDTLRAAGRCLSFSSLSKGAKVQATRCGGSKRQKVVLRGRTIRPAAAQGLCVTSAHAGKRLGDRLVLQPCEGKRGSGRQRWTI